MSLQLVELMGYMKRREAQAVEVMVEAQATLTVAHAIIIREAQATQEEEEVLLITAQELMEAVAAVELPQQITAQEAVEEMPQWLVVAAEEEVYA